MIHVFAFVHHRLCPNEGDERLGMTSRYLQGQWNEVEAQIDQLTCPVCKLVVDIMQGNQLVHLFNSNQRQLAETIRARFKEAEAS